MLFIDIGSDVRDKTNKIVAGLRARGISVCHPENSKALAPSVALGQQSLGQQFDAVVHFDLGIPHRFTSVLEAYELTGVRVMNRYNIASMLYNRIGLCIFLQQYAIRQPRWYYGYPGGIPADFGQQVVHKSVDGHLVHLVERGRIHSSDELGFYQELIPNHSGITHTVYWIFGHCFTATKSCVFTCPAEERRPKVMIDTTLASEMEVVDQIWRQSQLDFFCVEFVGDHVIDVNPYPNPFCHPEAVGWFVDGISQVL
ncbi:MAG: hypothetical protein WCX08_02530 [Candidatus Buchananbacteria bacterium]